jgi:anti-sigma regulatory factor (Ser/Thr protein kinase)
MTQGQSASFRCEVDQVQPAALWIQEQAAALGVSEQQGLRLALVLEEMFANTLHHGMPPADSRIDLSLCPDGGLIRLEYRDGAAAFDPFTIDIPDAPDLDSWPIGGLGLRLIRRVAERTGYERDGDTNRVTIWIKPD